MQLGIQICQSGKVLKINGNIYVHVSGMFTYEAH